MKNFGQKRPASENGVQTSSDAVKRKRGRPKKKPGYDRDRVIQDMLHEAALLYKEPYDDRKDRSTDSPTLVDVANAMQTTTLKVRKMLITTGYYNTRTSREVQKLYNSGCDIRDLIFGRSWL